MFALEGSSPSSCIFLFMQPNTKIPIVLGNSISNEDKERLLLRYSFVPQGINREKEGIVTIDRESGSSSVELFDDFDKRGFQKFCGSYKPSTKNEYILEFHDGKLFIEKIGGYINQLNVDTANDSSVCSFST